MSKSNKKKRHIYVCMGGTCYNKGSEKVMEKLEQYFGVEAGQENDVVDLDFCGCLGNCDFAVNLEVDGDIRMQVTPENVIEKINKPDNSLRKDFSELEDELENL